METEAQAILTQFRITGVSPASPVSDLPLGLRQRLEIVRAMLHQPRILLLDEPTAALTDREWLFGLIETLLARGTSILYITHRLDEVRRICHRCVILRNGRKVLDEPVLHLTDENVFKKMAGRSIVETYPDREVGVEDSAPPVFAGRNLSAAGIKDVSFTIRKGEVLGLAALEGQGQSRLFDALVGLNPLQQGSFEVAGEPAVIRSPRAARKAGIVLVPEERKSEGILHDLSTVIYQSPSSTGRPPGDLSAVKQSGTWSNGGRLVLAWMASICDRRSKPYREEISRRHFSLGRS
jgi:ribose transport system ATP-binding protein